MIAAFERDIARKLGRPPDPLILADLYHISADLARRRHRRTRPLDGADVTTQRR